MDPTWTHGGIGEEQAARRAGLDKKDPSRTFGSRCRGQPGKAEISRARATAERLFPSAPQLTQFCASLYCNCTSACETLEIMAAQAVTAPVKVLRASTSSKTETNRPMATDRLSCLLGRSSAARAVHARGHLRGSS